MLMYINGLLDAGHAGVFQWPISSPLPHIKHTSHLKNGFRIFMSFGLVSLNFMNRSYRQRQAASTWDQPLSQDGQLTKHAVHCSLASRSNSLKYLTGISHFHLIVTLRDKLLPLRMKMIDSSCLLKCLPLMTTGISGNLKSETKSSSKQELYLYT